MDLIWKNQKLLGVSIICCIQCLDLCVSLNGKPVNLHEKNYHYKTYIEKLINYGSDASGTRQFSGFWYPDSPGELKDNIGYAKRLDYPGNGKNLELYGRLHADLFNSDKMLINGVGMNIKFYVHRTLFIFWSIYATTNYASRF
jgi:hypothetical protein